MAAKIVSSDDWTPPAGMTKLRCFACNNWFASREGERKCATCRVKPRKWQSDDPFLAAGQRPASRIQSRLA